MTEPAQCQLCQRDVDPVREPQPRLTWVLDQDGDACRWTCPECTHEHVRAIEAKLSPEWW